MTVLFTEGFESGIATWGAFATAGNSVVAVSGVAHTSNYSLRSISVGTATYMQALLYRQLTTDLSEIFVTEWVNFTALPSTGWARVKLLALGGPASWEDVLTVNIGRNGVTGQVFWTANYYSDALADYDTAWSTLAPTVNTWHKVKVHYIIGAGTGVLQVWIDDVLVIDLSGLTNTGAAVGATAIRFVTVGMPVIEGSTVVTTYTDDVAVEDAGAATTGTLNVTSTQNGVSTSGAQVTVGGQTKATPCSFTLAAGVYTVQATYLGVSQSQTVTMTAGQTSTLNFEFAQVTNGYVTVYAYSGGQAVAASVTADGQSGTTPVTFSFPAGTYSVTATYQGVTLPPQSVTVVAGQTTSINLQFPAPKTLTINTTTGGTTNPASGTYQYNEGATVTITATPATGYVFSYWIVDGGNAGTTNPITITMTANHTVEPVFTIIVRTLTVVAAVGGATNPATGTYSYNQGSTAQVSATPSTGYKFSNWMLNGSNAGSANPINITMNADASIAPVFVQDTITLTVVAGANGAVSPSGQQILTIGTTHSFAALPSTNYVFDHWDLSGANLGTTNPLSLTATTDLNGKTLTAIFALYVPPPITLTVAASPLQAGTTTPSGSTQVTPGTVVQFTATKAAGWDFVQWQLNGIVYTNNPLSLPIVQSMDGQMLTALFTRGKINLTVAASLGGTVNPTGAQVLTIGQSYGYVATPSQGFVFDHWELGGVLVGTTASYQLTASLDMDGKTLLAAFVPAKISLFVTANAHGSVNPFGQQSLTVGTSYSFGAFPDSKYKLDHWELAGANLGSNNPIQITATLTMDGSTLSAFFLEEQTTPPQITMNMAVTPTGAGSTSPAIGSNTFNVGDLVQFTVTPVGDYAFVQWTLDGMTFNTNPLNLTIAQNMQGKTLTAQLAIPQVAVTIAASANGSVSPAGTQILVVGRTYQFAAIASNGYVFDHWELAGQDIGSANPTALTPTAANEGQSLIAFFKLGISQAGFPWWALIIAVPSAIAFTYVGVSPSGKKKQPLARRPARRPRRRK